jgi:hypothetical protein
MSWLYSQVLVAEYLGENFSDGGQSVQSNGNHIPQAYLSPDKMTDFSRLSRFGMTFKPLMDDLGEELLMSYLEAFRARTYRLLALGEESKVQGVVYGNTWQESLEKCSRPMPLLRIPLCFLREDWEPSLKTWPRWGTMLNGECFQQEPLEQTTRDKESGYLPTPTCHNAKEGAYPSEYTRNTPTLATHVGGKIHPEFTEWMMGWPLGWTGLKPLATVKYQQWQQAHGQSY